MNSKIGWILAIVFGVLLLLVLPVLWMAGNMWLGNSWHMMEVPLRATREISFGFPLRTLFGGLIGLGVVILVVVGIVGLVVSLVGRQKPALPPAPAVTTPPCSSCGKPAQPDWKVCPYCGNTLT